MTDKEILHKVADTILDNPITLTVDIKPQGKIHAWSQKIGLSRKVETFNVTGATLTNMIRIADILLDVDIKTINPGQALEWSYTLIKNEGRRMAEVIAIAIYNRVDNRPDSLVELILNNLTAPELKYAYSLVAERLNITDFIDTIGLAREMNLLAETSPTGPETIAAPITISGESAEALSSILGIPQIT